MEWSRRRFLQLSAGAGAGFVSGWGCAQTSRVADREPDLWQEVRASFDLDPAYIHLAGLLLASHPRPVREAVARHRAALDDNPALYAEEHRWRLEQAVRRDAARYLGVDSADVALTQSTTMGLALTYNGVEVRPDQELLTTEHDYYATQQALRYKRARSGAALRFIRLYERIELVSEDEMVERLVAAVGPRTRLVALTWVHSSTGLKIPVRRIADELQRINAGRDEADRVLLGVDAVHGLGVEAQGPTELGCDFYIAGTHKWLFGPRGTGIIWAHPRSQAAVLGTIPTFTPDGTWGGRMTPGGFKAFEHQWAQAQAFEFHRRLGKERVSARIHTLNRHCKEGLAGVTKVHLYTPMPEELSAGIVCFGVANLGPEEIVRRLRTHRIVASTTPYTPSYARLAPGLWNTPEEVEVAVAAIRDLT